MITGLASLHSTHPARSLQATPPRLISLRSPSVANRCLERLAGGPPVVVGDRETQGLIFLLCVESNSCSRSEEIILAYRYFWYQQLSIGISVPDSLSIASIICLRHHHQLTTRRWKCRTRPTSQPLKLAWFPRLATARLREFESPEPATVYHHFLTTVPSRTHDETFFLGSPSCSADLAHSSESSTVSCPLTLSPGSGVPFRPPAPSHLTGLLGRFDYTAVLNLPASKDRNSTLSVLLALTEVLLQPSAVLRTGGASTVVNED